MSESDLNTDQVEFSSKPIIGGAKTTPAGALLNNLMLLFIVVPVALVLKSFYTSELRSSSRFMVPYGLFVRRLAVRAVRQHLAEPSGRARRI